MKSFLRILAESVITVLAVWGLAVLVAAGDTIAVVPFESVPVEERG